MGIRKKLKTASRLVKEKNWSKIAARLKLRRRRQREAKNYQKWLLKNRLTDADRQAMRAAIAAFPRRPLISVLVPVYDIEEKFLRACLESVRAQIYENWELCAADDASPAPHVRRILEEYAGKDARIKTVFRAANGHISAASNSALELATGEFAALLDHDDALTEDALFHVAKEINAFPDAAFIYSDEDLIDAEGARAQPKFKPDWSPDLFYSVNYVTHFAVYRTEILKKIGGFRAGFEGSQDYDLALRFTERISAAQIRHIPRILYHWRAVEGSVAHSATAKPYAHERARAALREHFERTGKRARVERGIYELHRVSYELPEIPPKVSLILPVRGTASEMHRAALKFVMETGYNDLDLILIADEKPKDNVKFVLRDGISKSAALNRAAAQADGDVLCFADADLSPLSKDWLTELLSFALQKEIGAVGGKILASGETIAGGAYILGFEGTAGIANQDLPRDADEGLYRTRVSGNFSAVSARCLAVRRAIFEELRGFDAEDFPDRLFDADLCLRLRARDLRVIFTPYAELIETGKSVSPPNSGGQETEFFKAKWRAVIERDPFYNPNLSLRGETFTIKL